MNLKTLNFVQHKLEYKFNCDKPLVLNSDLFIGQTCFFLLSIFQRHTVDLLSWTLSTVVQLNFLIKSGSDYFRKNEKHRLQNFNKCHVIAGSLDEEEYISEASKQRQENKILLMEIYSLCVAKSFSNCITIQQLLKFMNTCLLKV